MNLKEAMERATGQPVTPEQVQRIQAIAHSLDIPAGDPMLAVLAIMDTYYGSISRVPKRMAEEADAAGKLAALNAKSKIEASVAELLKTVSSQIAESAQHALVKAAQARNTYATAVFFLIATVYTSVVTTFAFIAGEAAQSNKTGGFWTMPVWLNTSNAFMRIVTTLFNAPAGFVIPAAASLAAFVHALYQIDDSRPISRGTWGWLAASFTLAATAMYAALH